MNHYYKNVNDRLQTRSQFNPTRTLTLFMLAHPFLVCFALHHSDSLFRPDRLLHFGVSCGLAFVLTALTGPQSIVKVSLAVLLLGVCKEVMDPQWEALDLVANTLGLLTAVLFMLTFSAMNKKSWNTPTIY